MSARFVAGAWLVLAALTATVAARADAPPPGFGVHPDPELPVRNGFSGRLSIGPAYRVVGGHPGGAFDSEVALGAQFKRIGAVHGSLRLGAGQTDFGLHTVTVRFAPTWEFIFDAFRVGLGGGFDYLQIARATRDSSMTGFGYFGTLFASFDVYQSPYVNIPIGVTGELGMVDQLSTKSVSLLVGARFKAP